MTQLIQKWYFKCFSCFTTCFVNTCISPGGADAGERKLRLHPAKWWAFWLQGQESSHKEAPFNSGGRNKLWILLLWKKGSCRGAWHAGTAGHVTIHRVRGTAVFLNSLFVIKVPPSVSSPVVNASFILIAQKGCSCSPWFCMGPSSNELKDIRKKGAIVHNSADAHLCGNKWIEDLVWDTWESSAQSSAITASTTPALKSRTLTWGFQTGSPK